jgi:hypothetical protein
VRKVDQDHAIGDNAWKVGEWIVLCKPRTVLFQSKAILHRFVFREGAFLERMPVVLEHGSAC